MMGSSRTNVNEDDLDSILDMPLSIAGWGDIHRCVAQGVPEPIGNPRVYSMNPNSFQNPQTNRSSNAANTNLQEVPLLLDWSMGLGEQNVNQGHNAISAGGISSFGGESSFESFNRPQVNRDVTGSSFQFCSRDTAPVHTRNNVNFNNSKSGVLGKIEGSFLSLGLGGTSETVSRSQPDSREISYKRKEATSNELKIARARKATSQTFDGGLMGSQSNNSGFSNQFSYVSRMASTNNDDSFMGSSRHHSLQRQQNDRQLGRVDKPTEAASTELKMVHARKATGQTLDADIMGFQRNNNGFGNQFSNVDRMTSTNYEVGVHGSSRHHVSQMQQYDSRNIKSVDLDHYKDNQSVHSGTFGGNSAHFFNSQQHNLKPQEFVKPSWMEPYHTPSEQLQHFRSTTANSPKYAGQVISKDATPTQVLGGNLFPQRTTPQVSCVGSGPAAIDAPFPKRLGVELGVRNSPQSSHGHLSPMGTSLQTANRGGIDGAPVSYPVNYQDPFFTYGHSRNALIQLPKGPQGATSTNASSVDGQSQKLDFHGRRHHKRTAVAPLSGSHWVQRQKISHPTVRHSMPKPSIPVTNARVHPSTPVGSQTQHTGPVAAPIPHVIPYIKHRVPVGAPAVSHITWNDPNATSKLSGHKCFLCKRDLALTSEDPVFQPAVPPPVAVLPCGHTFHDQCLQNIISDDQAKDPPCIPCAIGEN